MGASPFPKFEHPIYVTRPCLPTAETYGRYVSEILARQQLTNNGPLVRELERRLEEHLGVANLLLIANGTLALQVAFRALGITGSVVTTPFSFVATASALEWEGLTPVFADIDPHTFNLTAAAAEAVLRADTSALLPVHVYGNPCDVRELDALAERRGLKLVYDAAHAFDVRLGGRSVLLHGDAQVLSFHATKVFHTAEGGAIVFRHREHYERARLFINFGIDTNGGRLVDFGINAKMSELHAAMGLAILDRLPAVIAARLELAELYRGALGEAVGMQCWNPDASKNGGYMPVLFASEEQREAVATFLAAHNVYPRRYFWPSLQDAPPYRDAAGAAPNARHVAARVLCLPLYPELGPEGVQRIAAMVRHVIG